MKNVTDRNTKIYCREKKDPGEACPEKACRDRAGSRQRRWQFGPKAVLCVILCIFLASVWGCSEKKEGQKLEKGQYYTYYVNQAGTALVSRIYEPDAQDVDGQIDELLGQCQTVPEGSDGRKAIPSNVTFAQLPSLENKILTIYFDTTYTMMDKVTELLCRAALAKTLTQLEAVDYISIYVNGEPYSSVGGGVGTGTDNTGENGSLTDNKRPAEPILLSAADFVDNTGDATNQYTQAEFTLYFANSEGTALVPESRYVVYSSSLSLERVVVNQLIEGPKTEGNIATLPPTLKVQGVNVRDGVCYVDFDSTFLEEAMNVSDAIEVYSLVNSLTDLPTVNAVQITINGSATETFRNNISLSGKFEQNLDYVENPEEQ